MMKHSFSHLPGRLSLTLIAPALLLVSSAPRALAQAVSTATQALQLSAFAAATGTYTGLEGGKNLAFTAGADLTLLSFGPYHPSIEVRGSYPTDSGHIDSQKDVLAGLRVDRRFGPFIPYVDVLAGRGSIDYQNGGITAGNFTYLYTSSTVYSLGAGIDLPLTHHWSVKADYQYQIWNTPVTSSGSIHPNVLTLGAVYNFDFNPHYHRPHQPTTTGEPR